MNNVTKTYGKYRAVVMNINDPDPDMGRVQVKCPALWGDSLSGWCPIVSAPGIKATLNVGDIVWIECEGGDPSQPIVSGIWYNKSGAYIVSITKGNVSVTGSIYASGSIIDEGGNTNHHSHG
jgi:hypothetical protein